MWCPTKKLSEYVRNRYISRYKVLDGVRFLIYSLHRDSEHHLVLSQLEGQLNELRKKEILGILDNDSVLHQAAYRLSMFLENLVKQERPYIFVYSRSKLNEKVSGILPGGNPLEYPSFQSAFSRSSDRPISTRTGKGKAVRWFLLLGIIAFVITVYSKSGDKLVPSPLDQVTSWTNDNTDLWAIHLKSFKNSEDAIREKNAFQSRNISIIKLNDDRYYLFIFHDTKASAIDEISGRNIKKEWPRARVIPIDLCDPIKDIRAGFYICK